MSSDTTSEIQQQPKLCHLKKFTLEQGYGFSIKKTMINDLYPIIDYVEKDSPADRAGIQIGDILIEVNYYDIYAESCKDVLKIIRYGLEIDHDKVLEHEVILLVIDKKSYDYYVTQNVKLRSTNDNVIKVEILSN